MRTRPPRAADCAFDDAALVGYEPEAGFADAYLVATGFTHAARHGAKA